MKDILRILVPIDFSTESELALDWAQMVAKNKAGATIYLLHTLPLADKPRQLGAASIGYQMETDEAKARLKQWLDRLPKETLAFPVYESGRVPEAIARVCDDKKIDLVVMTTRGRQGMQHILDGSITEETVRLAPCPVLVLHNNARAHTGKAAVA